MKRNVVVSAAVLLMVSACGADGGSGVEVREPTPFETITGSGKYFVLYGDGLSTDSALLHLYPDDQIATVYCPDEYPLMLADREIAASEIPSIPKGELKNLRCDGFDPRN